MNSDHGKLVAQSWVPALLLVIFVAAVISAGCNSSGLANHTQLTSIPGARLYGVGGIISALFPTSVSAFQGPFSAATSAIGGLSAPGGHSIESVAIDPTDTTGAVYVSTDAGQILKFPRPNPNSTNPIVTVSGFTSPQSIRFDTNGNLFVLDGQTIYTLQHPITNASVPHSIITSSLALFNLTLDASNNLYVCAVSTPTLQMYVPPYTSTPVTTNNVALGGGSCFLTYDQAANLLYAFAPGTVTTYNLPLVANETPSARINVVQSCMGGLTFDASGDSFLAFCSGLPSGGSIAVATPPFTGQAAFTFQTPYFMSLLVTGP